MLLTAFGKKPCPEVFALCKTGRMRKLLILSFLAACLQIPLVSKAQGISLEVQDALLENVFNLVQRQSPYRFVYASEDMAATKKVTVSVTNAPIATLLEKIFKDQPIGYNLRGQVIMVSKINQPLATVQFYGFTVTGKVIDEEGKGLPAVTITLKQNKFAVATDEQGYFKLTDVNPASAILFSSVGYETKEIKIEGRNNLTVQLFRSVGTLDETVIKGYYNTSKRLNTGSVAKITGEEISRQPVSNPLEALEGRMAGLYVQQTSGIPGAAINIQIRGINSLRTTGNFPLYVVDGVPYTSASLSSNNTPTTIFGGGGNNPLDYLNPADIESIEVLKDADATAIYGSRGANGVILITTKKGKAGKTKFDLNFYTGAGKVTRMMHLLNTSQYLEMRHEAFRNDNAVPDITDYDLNGNWDTTRYTNWQKMLIGGTTSISNAQATISGGSANTQFLLGAGYFRQGTVFPGDFYSQKASLHLNINHVSEDHKFIISLTAGYVASNNRLPQADITRTAVSLAPDAPNLYDQNGQLNWQGSSWTNPMSLLMKQYKGNSYNLISNINLSYQLLQGLFLKTSLGYSKQELQGISTVPIYSWDPAFNVTSGRSFFATTNTSTWLIEPQLNYQHRLGQGKVDVLFGTTFQENKLDAQTLRATGFSNDALLENVSAASGIALSNARYIQYKYNAFFGRINYNYKDKYLVNLTARRDGSSRFGPGRQFGNFGAIGLAWIFSNETFIKNNLPFLSFGKLRSSYGITGNDQITDYQYLSTYSATAYTYQGNAGLIPNRLVNPVYSWETNKKFEATVELGFLKDKLLVSASYFRNRSSDQLVGYSLPYITGFTDIQFNLPAIVQNTGVEIELNTVNYKNKNWTWKTNINLTIPRNKLVSYPGIEGTAAANNYAVGKSLYIKNKYHFLQVDPNTGIYVNEDINADGIINSDDLQFLKEVRQNYFGGIQNSITFKNFQLDVLFQFVKQTGIYPINNAPGSLANQSTEVLNRWQKTGDITSIGKFSQDYAGAVAASFNDAYLNGDHGIGDASFIRLKNIALSWKMPPVWLQRIKIKSIRLFIQAQNLLTVTKYKGMDPENQSLQQIPPLRVLTAGVQVSL